MTDKNDFIEQEILPTLGDFAVDFYIEALCDAVSEYSPKEGYVWRPEYTGEFGSEAYWEVVRQYAR